MPSASGQVTNEYYVNDLVAAQTIAGSQRYSWSLDPVGRRTTNVQQTWTNGAWAGAVTKVSHYASDSDEPSWVAEDASLPSAVTRYVSGVEGDIAVTTSTTGGRVVQLIDLHGDVAGTVPIADGASVATWSGLNLERTDEFGNPEPLTGAGATTGPPARYGWLGGAQRSSEALGGLVLMGARLYSPVTGRFASVDPVPGGSANAYDYCNADPVNCTDLDGTWPKINWGKVLKVVAVVGEVASLVPGPIGAAAAGVSAVAYAATGNKSKAIEMGVTAVASLVGAGPVVKVASRAVEVARASGQLAERALPKVARTIAARAGSAIKSTCNSFVPGTLVLMADGSTKPIEDITAGDQVATGDATGIDPGGQPVLNLIEGYGDKHLIQLDTADGPIIATANHPIWVDGTGWTDAGNITAGQHVITTDATPVTITAVTDLGTVHQQWVYNLHVANNHTYYILPPGGSNTVLVHNNATCSVFLNDPMSLTGASRSSVKRLLAAEGWVHDGKIAKGFGARYIMPGSRGVQVLMEKGAKTAAAKGMTGSGLHFGHYIKISSGSAGKVHVALRGNPSLG